MSVTRPARCLFTASSIPKGRTTPRCPRAFHTSPNLAERRRPRFASVKASDMGLISKSSNQLVAGNGLHKYDDAQRQALSERYTPEQMRAIEEGEAAIDEQDILKQGRARIDPYGLKYFDDLSHVQPVIDKRPREKGTVPANAKFLTQEEEADEMAGWIAREWSEYEKTAPMDLPGEIEQMSEDQINAMRPNRMDFLKYMEESTSMTGGGKRGTSVIAPALGKVPAVEELYRKSETEEANMRKDPDGKFTSVIKDIGTDIDAILNLKIKVLVRHRVVNQTRLGKIQSMYSLAIAGNGDGMLGIGEGKSQEADDSMDKAKRAAIRNMKPIPRYEERTIFGEVESKVAASVVKLMSRPPGFGLRVQHNIFEMARAAGIQDLAARVPRSRNKMNTIKATFEALMNQRLPEDIARGRGKKLVDVRKVYYGGNQFIRNLDKNREYA